MLKVKPWALRVLVGVLLAFVLVLAAPFLLARRARARAAMYLNLIVQTPIGTPYDVVAAQLRNTGLPIILPDDCRRRCRVGFSVDDSWLHRLHLVPPTTFWGVLEFADARLFSKSTYLDRNMQFRVHVAEGGATSAKMLAFDSSGRLSLVSVELPLSGSAKNRTSAYLLNLRCLGSVLACREDEYLPGSSSISLLNVTVHSLDDESPQAEELKDRIFQLPEIQAWLHGHGCVWEHYVVPVGMSTGGLPTPWRQFSIHAREVPLSVLMSEAAAQAHADGWAIDQDDTRRCTVDIGWGSVQSQDKR